MPTVTTMLKGEWRRCDVCDEVIPRGTLYHVAFTTPEELESWFDNDPDVRPELLQEEDGRLRFDVCTSCAITSDMLGEGTEPTVDPLH